MLATEVVTQVAKELGALDIPVMPVKGALLQHWLYERPQERPLSDVDLLVPPARFAEAVGRLESRGYTRIAKSSIGAVVMKTPLALPLDLHPRLFDAARYRFPTRALFERGVIDDTLYGARVWLPSRLDAYAHLVGKAGSDHLDARAHGRLAEIAALGLRIDAPPGAVADHLVRCGMGRVSRYVLPLVGRVTGDGFAYAVADRLPDDRVGEAIASVARLALPRLAPSSAVGATIAHLMNDSLLRAAVSGVRAMRRRTREP